MQTQMQMQMQMQMRMQMQMQMQMQMCMRMRMRMHLVRELQQGRHLLGEHLPHRQGNTRPRARPFTAPP